MAAASSAGRLRAASSGASDAAASGVPVPIPNGVYGAHAVEQDAPSTHTKRRLTTFQKIFRPWKWKKRRRSSVKEGKPVSDQSAQGMLLPSFETSASLLSGAGAAFRSCFFNFMILLYSVCDIFHGLDYLLVCRSSVGMKVYVFFP